MLGIPHIQFKVAYEMTKHASQPVMDIWPWPNGQGFKDGSSWWEYVHSQNEKEKLELLMAVALLSEEVCRLLIHCDKALLDVFQFSEQTIALLCAIEADSLMAFAEALLEMIDSAELA